MTLTKLCRDESFSIFWDLVQKKAAAVNVNVPRLPRHWKVPQWFETGDGSAHFSTRVKAHYRQIYFQVLDSALSTIKDRFDQPSCEVYKQAEDLLKKTVREEDASSKFATVQVFFGDDFNHSCLSVTCSTI